MDDGVGRVLACLDECGFADDTLVIFTSDNGGQLDVGANNGPLRNGKQSMYEGGLRVPAIVRWPGRTPPGAETDARVMTMDLFPTVLAADEVEFDDTIDGVSILPILQGEEQPPLREHWFFTRREGGNAYGGKTIDAVIRGDWKLLQNSPFGPLELYNLRDDPQEQHDLSRERPQIFNELSAALRQQIQRAGGVPWQPHAD
jgi:arylsulfatase A-like enzyme